MTKLEEMAEIVRTFTTLDRTDRTYLLNRLRAEHKRLNDGDES